MVSRICRTSAKRNERTKELLHIERVCSHPTERQCWYKPIRNMLRKEWVTIEKNCWFDREGHTFLYITQTVTNVRLVPQRIESWPLSSFRLNHWRVECPTAGKSLLQQKGGRNLLLGRHDTLRERRALTYRQLLGERIFSGSGVFALHINPRISKGDTWIPQ